jgi:hypothetical protein
MIWGTRMTYRGNLHQKRECREAMGIFVLFVPVFFPGATMHSLGRHQTWLAGKSAMKDKKIIGKYRENHPKNGGL